MRTTVRKWGNSLGVRIPRVLASQVRLAEGVDVDVRVRHGELVIVPVLSLAELVARITPENLPELGEEAPRDTESW